jgi:hypothetical protein
MACIALFAPAIAVATKQFARAVRFGADAPWQMMEKVDQTALRMNWIVVTDDKGVRVLRMQWHRSGSD